MKKFFYLILCCCAFTTYANNRTFTKLAEVNKCWTEQTDISQDALPAYHNQSETEWIRTHLALVEATLRSRNTQHLSATQQRNRMQCLDDLHQYWQTGNFPVNDAYSYRTPIFIDKYDNFCAVGYLVKASGNEHISRMIAAKTNLAYVRQMNYPELNEWAANNGFTTAELAWIQPGYPPSAAAMPIGQGVNGVVNELYVDEAAGKMYVGGNFSEAIGATAAANIAYVTQNTSGAYTWHKMDNGLPGTVNAIAQYEGKIFAGGQFNMAGTGIETAAVAYWDGIKWTAAGCLNGTVRDLAVYEGQLYACGELNDCSGSSAPQTLARWNGTAWQSVSGALGNVNTMQVVNAGSPGAYILLGGAGIATFTNPSITGHVFGTTPLNEIMDLEIFQDTVYAACRRTHATDTNTLLLKLCGDPSIWSKVPVGEDGFMPPALTSFNTIHADGGGLNIGGQFDFSIGMTYASNCYHTNSYGNWLVVDSTVNKMETFNGRLIVAGAFKNGSAGGWGGNVALNGIAARKVAGVDVPSIPAGNVTATIFPNPVDAGATVTIANSFNANQYTLHHITGRNIASGNVNNAQTIYLPHIPAGIYMVTLTNVAGDKTVQKLQVR